MANDKDKNDQVKCISYKLTYCECGFCDVSQLEYFLDAH